MPDADEMLYSALLGGTNEGNEQAGENREVQTQQTDVQPTESPASNSNVVSGILQTKIISKEEMKMCTKSTVIGNGSYSTVFEGSLHKEVRERLGRSYEGVEIVVKQMTLKSAQDKKHYMADQQYSHLVKTPFLMPLMCQALDSFTDTRDHYHCLMFPRMKNGDLHEYLFGKDGKPSEKPKLKWKRRTRILYQIALALEALHKPVAGRRTTIVHRDVKSRNVFLDSSLNARLGDNGLCKEIDTGNVGIDSSNFNAKEPARDPQSYSCFMPGSDWFSYGIVGLELLLDTPVTVECRDGLLRSNILSRHENIRGGTVPLAKEVHALWEDDDAKKEVSSIVALCISGERHQGEPQWCPQDRNKWLGLTIPDQSPAAQSEYQHWSALQPSILLERLCLQHNIALYKKPDDESKKRCIACFADLEEHEKKELHTRSVGCSKECQWYCRICMSSREPLFCPDHGRAMPLIGGDNTYALLMHGEVDCSDTFKKDVDLIKEVLEDVRFVGIRTENINILPFHAHAEDKSSHTIRTSPAQSEDEFSDNICAIATKLRAFSLLAIEQQMLRVYPTLENHLNEFVVQASIYIRRENVKKLLLSECQSMVKKMDADFHKMQQICRQASSDNVLIRSIRSCIGTLDVGKSTVTARLDELLNEVCTLHKNLDKDAHLKSVQTLVMEMCQARCKDNDALKIVADALLTNPGVFDEADMEAKKALRQYLEGIAGKLFGKFDQEMERHFFECLKQRHGTVWVYYSGHAKDGNLCFSPTNTITKAAFKVWLDCLLKMASNMVVLVDCCEAESAVNDLIFNLNPLDEFSSLFCVASCTARQKSAYRPYHYSIFTALLASVLSSCKKKICKKALEEGSTNAPSNVEHVCSSGYCSLVTDESEPCPASFCAALADKSNPLVQCYLTQHDICGFLDDHLCSDRMRCSRRFQQSKHSLPLAYLVPQLFYEVSFRYPRANRDDMDVDFIVQFDYLPASRLTLLGEIFRKILMHQQNLTIGLHNAHIKAIIADRLGTPSHEEALMKMNNTKNYKQVTKLLTDCFQLKYMPKGKEQSLNDNDKFEYGREIGVEFEEMIRQMRLGLIVMCSIRLEVLTRYFPKQPLN